MKRLDELMKLCQERLARGATVDDILTLMREHGLSKVQSIKMLVDLGQASISDAKSIVHGSRIWADVQVRDDAFHDAVVSDLEKQGLA